MLAPVSTQSFAPAAMLRQAGKLVKKPLLPPRRLPTTGFPLIDRNVKVDEETWSWYEPGLFYPVRLGQVFQSRYQILSKFGYGTRSTVWLARDLSEDKYVTVKVGQRDSTPVRRELAAYEYLSKVQTAHAGTQYVRTLQDAFKVGTEGAEHQCFVHEPLYATVKGYQETMPGGKLPEHFVKDVLRYLLMALDYMHSKAGMIHGDLQAANIHFRLGDQSIFRDFEEQEFTNPGPRKIDGDRIIYKLRNMRTTHGLGAPVLCDLGEARWGQNTYLEDAQPFLYRAPEVIFDVPWSYAVDIWNVGVMVFDMLENRHLFHARVPNTPAKSSTNHLAEMIALMGPPPVEYLQRGISSAKWFDRFDGDWLEHAEIPSMKFEDYVTTLQGAKKEAFLRFIRKMIRWVPEERATARELLDDEWLNT